MTKQEFFNLLDNLDNASQYDIDQLGRIFRQYPYFQAAPILQAKIADKIGSSLKNKYITKAALYTADRANLKSFLEGEFILTRPHSGEEIDRQEYPSQKEETKTVIEMASVTVEEEIKPSDETENSPSELLYKDVMKNLEKLRSLRKKYEFLEEQELLENEPDVKTKVAKKNKKAADSEKEKSKTKPTPKRKPRDDDEKDPAPKLKETQKENPSKLDITEQNLLIESFIKNESDFSKKKPDINNENKHDLSEKSTTIGDEIISENLAEIMQDQGKAEKAIEIYRKLIWKFPQKKAYFASRIEELTNR